MVRNPTEDKRYEWRSDVYGSVEVTVVDKHLTTGQFEPASQGIGMKTFPGFIDEDGDTKLQCFVEILAGLHKEVQAYALIKELFELKP